MWTGAGLDMASPRPGGTVAYITTNVTWTSPVTYTTTSNNTTTVHLVPYGSTNSTATWTVEPDEEVTEPCPYCTDGTTPEGRPCGACDATGTTWHYKSEEP